MVANTEQDDKIVFNASLRGASMRAFILVAEAIVKDIPKGKDFNLSIDYHKEIDRYNITVKSVE